MLRCDIDRELGRMAARSLAILEADSPEVIARYVARQLNPDGGFRGRSPESDLYYTLFGVDALTALGSEVPGREVKSFLDAFGDVESLDMVHLSCLARILGRCLGKEAVAERLDLFERLERFAAPGGGYRLSEDVRYPSVYAAFLAVLAYAAAGLQVPGPELVLASVQGLRSGDGAFSDLPGAPEGTTTVTAAAVVLQAGLAGLIDGPSVQWLRARQSAFGGFVAGPQVVVPDLLSTATTLHALAVLGLSLGPDAESALEFIEASWQPSGGFSAHPLDEVPDCEFTYYGLLGLGALVEAA